MTQQLRVVDGESTDAWDRVPDAVELRDVHEREVAIVRVEVPPAALKTAIGEGLAELARAGDEAAVAWAGPPFVRYRSWGADRIVAEVGVPVGRPMPRVGRVEPGRLPGGRVASVIHRGPYETIATTYEVAMRRLGELGLRSGSSMWEVYWTDPGAEPDPAAWVTEVFIPVE